MKHKDVNFPPPYKPNAGATDTVTSLAPPSPRPNTSSQARMARSSPSTRLQPGLLQAKPGDAPCYKHKTWPPVYRAEQRSTASPNPSGARAFQPGVAQGRLAVGQGKHSAARIQPPVYKASGIREQPQAASIITARKTPRLVVPVLTAPQAPVINLSGKKSVLQRAQTAQTNSKRLTFNEGASGVVEAGYTVDGADITSCGLVIGYGSAGIAVYHWPFMTDSSTHYDKFAGEVANIGTLKRIEVYTNKIPTGAEQQYEHTTEVISIKHKKKTVHYVTASFKGNITILLGDAGAQSVQPGVTQWRSFR